MSKESLKEIIEGITNNELLLPNFQREFIWTLKQQKDLIASVLSSVPASSSLLVEEKNFEKPKFNCINIGMRNKVVSLTKKRPFYYILDGQQRFTTLYYAFFNVFNKENSEENQNIFNELNKKLRVRWCLKFKSKENYLFNYDTLIFDKDIFDKYLPDDFIDFIYEISINENDLENKENIITKIKKDSIDNLFIPLQYFFTEDSYKIKKWLKEIQIKRQNDLKNKPEYRKSLIAVFKKCNVEEPEKVAEELYDDKERAEVIFNKCIESENICDWYDKLFSYLGDILSDCKIKPIVLQDMFKAISTFEYINTRGTDLSTFDLLCAKSDEGFDLRKNVLEESLKPFKFFNNEFREEMVSLNKNFGLIDDNDSIQKQYAEYISQVFNLLHFKENNGEPQSEKFNVGVQKAKYSLDNLDFPFLKANYKKVVEVINKTSAILQIFCCHKDYNKITNKLILLPVFTFFVYKDEDPTEHEIKNIIAFFWIKLFTGKYNSHQSESAKDHCTEIYKWLILKDITVKDELKTELNNNVLNVPNFADKKLLTTQTCIKSVEDNIFMFMRSYKSKFYDWDNSSTVLDILDDTEIHHIIPLFTGITKMKELTKALREDPKNILNATMNKTPISKKCNRDIGAKSPYQYINDVKVTQLNHHFINKNWFVTNPTKKHLFEARYNELISQIRVKLDEYLD